ncbi:MAG: T9SS type A sorting domain-containing protein [Bacteroidota bacterium]|nr:T9SS type A sorting domain-containing protein [Bacteroidota bacterium]
MKRIQQRAFFLVAMVLLTSLVSYSQQLVGRWTFDNSGNLEAASTGNNLNLAGINGGNLNDPAVGTQTAISGPSGGNGAVTIGIGSQYIVTHGIGANGGGLTTNEYTLAFDFRVPALGAWYTFFQTNQTNSNDAEFFIKPTGEIGQGNPGYTSLPVVVAGTWHRLIVSIDLGNFFRYYLDGTLIKEGTSQGIDGQFALDPTFILFGDNDGDDASIDIAEVAMWDYPLTGAEALAFGAVESTPLPVELTSFTASAINKGIELAWNTATEINNYGFDVERKSSLEEWRKIGFVGGHGTTNAPQQYSFTDANAYGKTSYRLKQIDRDGKFEYGNVVEVTAAILSHFSMDQNYPNPFNPTTKIDFSILADGLVSLKVYNLLGQEVATIVNQHLNAGKHIATFNASNLISGVYFYKIEAGSFTSIKKMMVLK